MSAPHREDGDRAAPRPRTRGDRRSWQSGRRRRDESRDESSGQPRGGKGRARVRIEDRERHVDDWAGSYDEPD